MKPKEVKKKQVQPEKKWLKWALPSGILLITFISFFPSLKDGLVFWDDNLYITDNPYTKAFNLKEIFGAYFMSNYHPLTLISYCIEYKLFGTNIFMIHLDNVLLHLLNTLLVFIFVHRLFNGKKIAVAAITALLFGIHPMHVESVTWISERKDVLYSLFFLLSMLSYLFYVRQGRKYSYLIVVFILSLLSLLAKGQAVTLPLIFLLIDYLCEKKITARYLLEKIPFLILSFIFGFIAIKAQAAGGSTNATNSLGLKNVVFGFYGLLLYLVKFFLPVHLSGIHPYPFVAERGVPAYAYSALLLIPILCFIIFKLYKTNKEITFGLLFFLVAIIPVLKFLPVGDAIMSERYTYIPYIGLFLIVGYLYDYITTNQQTKKYSRLATGFMLIVVLVLSIATYNRTQVWKDNYTFWSNVVQEYPNYWRGNHFLGKEYYDRGEYDKAYDYFNRAIESDKDCPPIPYLWRGATLSEKLNKPQQAIPDFKMVIQMSPDPHDELYQKAILNLGLVYYEEGKNDTAMQTYRRLLPVAPDNAKLHSNIGAVYAAENKNDLAIAEYNKSIELDPTFAEPYLNRGVIYSNSLGQYDQGIADFKKALELDPTNVSAEVNIGVSLYKKGDNPAAINQYNAVLNTNPGISRIYYLRALAYAENKEYTKAINDAEQAKKSGNPVSEEVVNSWRARVK